MDQPTEDRLIREAAQRFLAENHAFRLDRLAAGPDSPGSRQLWQSFAALGWLGLGFPESEGGFGADTTAMVALLEEFGRALVLESYIGGVVLPGQAILKLGSPTQRAELLGALIEGRSRFALAHQEMSWDRDDIITIASEVDGGWRLTGRKLFVLGGATADFFLVSARRGSDLALFVVPRHATGVELDVFRAIDGTFAANIELRAVAVDRSARLANDADPAVAITRTLSEGIAAACADAAGAMLTLLHTTVAYTQSRKQFGQPLAKYQVLQHRMARMAILCEEAQAAALHASFRVADDAIARQRAISGSKAKVGMAARWVAQQAIQLHGGMGMTTELSVGWYAKRLLLFESLLGTTQQHLDRYAQLLRDTTIGEDDVLTTQAQV
jgi:alkylation response protein AidB-like acyl-CoA dehydrogenase